MNTQAFDGLQKAISGMTNVLLTLAIEDSCEDARHDIVAGTGHQTSSCYSTNHSLFSGCEDTDPIFDSD